MRFCSFCGHSNADEAHFCAQCGRDFSPAAAAAGAPGTIAPGATGVPAQTSGMAIASLVCGIFFFMILPAILAVIFGHLAHSEIGRRAGQLKGAGMATAGLVLGYLGIVMIPIMLIIAAIAIPNLLRSRMAANEASAVGSLRVLSTAVITYASTYKGYPGSLMQLAPPAHGERGTDAADLIDEVLAGGQKAGYVFSYRAWDSDGDGWNDAYELYADPVTPGTTGVRHFFTDQSGVIRYEHGKPAGERSPPIS